MEIIIKKLEEQISFLQNEVNQMSDEIFTQQKEIIRLNNELINLKNKINIIDENTKNLNSDDDIPPPSPHTQTESIHESIDLLCIRSKSIMSNLRFSLFFCAIKSTLPIRAEFAILPFILSSHR